MLNLRFKNYRIFSHTRSPFKRLMSISLISVKPEGLRNPLTLLARGHCYIKKIHECNICLMEWNFVKSIEGPQSSWENYFSKKHYHRGMRETKSTKWWETLAPSQILARCRIIKLLSCSFMLPVVKKEEEWLGVKFRATENYS